MGKTKIIILIAVIVITIVFLFFYFALPNKNADVQYEVTELASTDAKSKVYIKKKIWGMTSDNQLITISTSNEQSAPNNAEDYIYEGVMPMFYKLQKDTLFIYTLKVSSVPKNFKNSFKIIQIQLENPEMMQLIEQDNYKNQGLKMIS